MNNTIFVSGADHNYFPMLLEWVHSIRRFEKGKNAAIGILNSGLKDNHVQILKNLGCTVKDAQWPCPLPQRKIQGRDYLKSCVCRPFLPEYFKEYNTIVWMDADIWVQDWNAVDLYLQGAQEKKTLTITPQTDRAYGKSMRLQWLGSLPWKARSFYYSNAKKAFSSKIARELFPHAALNAGIFSMPSDAPHWTRWQELVLQALKKGKIFTAEQLTLGMLVYLDKYSHEFLPAWCNWLCETKPMWDDKNKIFVEPYLPHQTIGIMHLSGWDDMRINRSLLTDFKTTAGHLVQKSYRYPYFDGEKIKSWWSKAFGRAPQTPRPCV